MVTIDTSMAHLSGALGLPTWIPLKHAPDWRFGDTGTDWPWYPNARLFRQPTVGDWNEPFARIAAELREAVAQGGLPKMTPKPLVIPSVPPPAPRKTRDFSRLDRFLDTLERDAYPEEPASQQTSIVTSTIDKLHRDGLLKAGQSALDIGCGQGLALELLGKLGLKATGIARGSDAAVCRAKGLDVVEMDQNFMDFPDASFDVLWCRHVLEHSAMPLFTLSEYKRICRPAGVIYVEVPAADMDMQHQLGANYHSILPMSAWTALIAKAGLAIERAWEIGLGGGVQGGADKYWSFLLRRPV
jgi:SAM-dependent methyltransferase